MPVYNKKTGQKYINRDSQARSVYIITRLAQGATVQKVAEELGITVQTVNARLKRETEAWLKNMGNVVAQIKVLETQQLNYIYTQAMQSWQLTTEPDTDGNITKPGDPRYLDTAMKALRDVRDLWNAKDRIEITDEGDAILTEHKGLAVDNISEVLQVLESINALPEGIDQEKIKAHIVPSESTYAQFTESYENFNQDSEEEDQVLDQE